MSVNNSLTARYLPVRKAGFIFFYCCYFGYAKKNELRPDYQVHAFDNQLNSLITSL